MKKKPRVIVPGEGVYISTWRRVLDFFAFTIDGTAGAGGYPVELVFAFLPASVEARAKRFVRDGTEVPRVFVVEDEAFELGTVINALEQGGSPLGSADSLEFLYWRDYLSLTHELKYLLACRGSPSSWFFTHPYESAGEWNGRFGLRVEKVGRLIVSIERRIGSSFERETLGPLLDFCSGLMALVESLPRDHPRKA